MTLGQCKRQFKAACKARAKAVAQYRKFLLKLYVRDRNTGEYVNATQICFLADGDIAYVTSYAEYNMDNRILVAVKRRGDKVSCVVAGNDVWEHAKQLQDALPKTYAPVVDLRLQLHNEFGMTFDEIRALLA